MQALRGNPVAVVHDAQGLEAREMQRLASWTNLSETTFLAPPGDADADYALRIFTPDRELPFAGHPTLGACHAWLAAGGRPSGDVIVQECAAGLVRIRREEAAGTLAFAAPERNRCGPLADDAVTELAGGLGVDRSAVVASQWCDNGPPWEALLLDSADTVLGARPSAARLAGRFVGIVAPRPAGSDARFEVRAFFPGAHGIAEDPVTGSLNAALAQWLVGDGLAPNRYVAAQGTALGRAGRVTVELDGTDTWIGGACVTVVAGSVTV